MTDIPDREDSENPYSEDYVPKEEPPKKEDHTAGGSLILAIFFVCYAGYEIWFQWDFKGKGAVQLAVLGLVILFLVLYLLFASISYWIKKTWGKTGSLIAFFSGFLLMLLTSFFLNPEARHERWARPFREHIEEYLAIKPVDLEDKPDILIAKVVVIETGRHPGKTKIVSDRLQRNLRADDPDEVNTVIILKWGEKKLPVNDQSVVENCQLTAIRVPQNEIIAEKFFQAEWREINHKTKGKIWSGYLDETRVYQYIRNLPSRSIIVKPGQD